MTWIVLALIAAIIFVILFGIFGVIGIAAIATALAFAWWVTPLLFMIAAGVLGGLFLLFVKAFCPNIYEAVVMDRRR